MFQTFTPHYGTKAHPLLNLNEIYIKRNKLTKNIFANKWEAICIINMYNIEISSPNTNITNGLFTQSKQKDKEEGRWKHQSYRYFK